MEELTNTIFQQNFENTNDTPPIASIEEALESLENFIIGLYSEIVAIVVALINKAIGTNTHTICSILLVDSPGFQNPSSCGVQSGATLSDLNHNYLQERLHLLFYNTTIVAPLNRYTQEQVEINKDDFNDSNPGKLIALIDKIPQNRVVRSSQRDLREQDRRGLLWLLDEESMFSNSNDGTFLERLFSQYGERDHQTILRRGSGQNEFILQHLQGTNPILYRVKGWLKANKEHSSMAAAATVLHNSNKYEISKLCSGLFLRSGGGGESNFYSAIVGADSTQSLRRVSSIRRSFISTGSKKKSVMLQVS